MPNINDYLIDPAGKDWKDLLSGWEFLLPRGMTVWLVNRLGDVFAVLEDGSVEMLDVGAGTLTRIADDRDDFSRKIGQRENANNWLMLSLVDQCVAAGMILTAGQCYGFKLPPALGGKYLVENMERVDLSVHYWLLAEIHRKTKDLPIGTKISSITIEE